MANSEIFNKNHNDSTDIWDDTALIKMYEDSIKPSMPAVRTWNVGDKCVAQYAEDGLWYKGTITKISGTVANVLFDGYEEEPEAEVELSDLADFIENEEDESNTENEEVANSLQSHNLPSNVRENPLGAVFGSSGQNFLPPFAPPPPPVFKNLTQPDEIEALSSMLMSWYMSGYHTGCYVTMSQMRQENNSNGNNN